jgi:hypothetical protein
VDDNTIRAQSAAFLLDSPKNGKVYSEPVLVKEFPVARGG